MWFTLKYHMSKTSIWSLEIQYYPPVSCSKQNVVVVSKCDSEQKVTNVKDATDVSSSSSQGNNDEAKQNYKLVTEFDSVGKSSSSDDVDGGKNAFNDGCNEGRRIMGSMDDTILSRPLSTDFIIQTELQQESEACRGLGWSFGAAVLLPPLLQHILPRI